jgi:hypothetical protein
LIVLNPFLDFLCNFGLKNIGLTPGTGLGCFQSSQDIGYNPGPTIRKIHGLLGHDSMGPVFYT